ncbi:tachylectin-related carbohydrate-binding protein [Actinomycetes bacterium KLBMP 9797]
MLVGSAPAQAADTFQCSGNATIFGTGNDGKLYRYSYSGVGSTAAAGSAGVEVGQGWNGFPRILGGPDGRVYGINSAGMYRYRWNGSGWDSVGGAQSKLISTNFADYATAAFRNKITVDEIGDFYVVDGAGKLRWWRYDEGNSAWSISGRVIDTGWDRFDLIVSAGPGVLWGREPDGDMYRSRFEPTSQRWIVQHQFMGTGWGMFDRGIFSVGGDALFGVRGNGDLNHYRWREAGPEPVWPVGGIRVGTGWSIFNNVFGVTNTCRLTERHIPASPPNGIQAFTSVAVRQGPNESTQLGPIEYVYSDNIGRLRHAYQENPNTFGNVQWSTVPTDEAFTGKPALVLNGQNTLQVLAHNITSETWSFTRAASPSRSWQAGLDLDGAMQSRPVAVRLTDGSLVAFAIDAERNLWFRSQDGAAGDLLPWRRLPVQNVSGEVVAVPGADRSVTVFTQAFDSMQWRSSIYRDGALTGGGSLGGAVGTPAVVVMPGRILRLFARTMDGYIVTQQQGAGGAWPGSWAPVGTFSTAGPPAAVLDPQSGRLTVVARGVDDHIYRVFESAPGVGTWGNWARVYTDGPDPVVTEPTIAEYTSSEGQSWLIVARNQNDSVRVYTRDNGSAMRSTSAPTFARHTLPAPPR